MRLRPGGHLIAFLVSIGLVTLLTIAFVRENLGGDFIGYVDDADGTDHPYYRVGSIALLFCTLAVPTVLLGALSWEVALWIGWVMRRLRIDR